MAASASGSDHVSPAVAARHFRAAVGARELLGEVHTGQLTCSRGGIRLSRG